MQARYVCCFSLFDKQKVLKNLSKKSIILSKKLFLFVGYKKHLSRGVKHLCQSLFFNSDSSTDVFLGNLTKFLKARCFFCWTSPVAASGDVQNYISLIPLSFPFRSLLEKLNEDKFWSWRVKDVIICLNRNLKIFVGYLGK